MPSEIKNTLFDCCGGPNPISYDEQGNLLVHMDGWFCFAKDPRTALASLPDRTGEPVAGIVDALFEDLRDRRFLKWLFSETPAYIGRLEGDELHSLDAEVQQEIKSAWAKIIEDALASPETAK